MKCFSLFVGSRNGPDAGRRFAAGDDERMREITFAHFPGGFTILNADGGWFDPARGKFVEEESRQIFVVAPDREHLRPWYDALCQALDQQELLVIELGEANFVRPATPPAHG